MRVKGQVVRGQLCRRHRHDFWQLEHLADQRQFALVRQQRDVTRGLRIPPQVSGVAQYARDAGVGILDIVHRVLIRLLNRQFQIEINRRINRAHEQQEMDRVRANLVEQLAQRDELPGPLRHAHVLATPLQIDHLVDDEYHPLRVQPQRLCHRLHARHVTVMVGPPDVDGLVKAALDQFVPHVGHVGGEVGGPLVRLWYDLGGADEDRVRIQVGRGEPDRAVALDDIILVP